MRNALLLDRDTSTELDTTTAFAADGGERPLPGDRNGTEGEHIGEGHFVPAGEHIGEGQVEVLGEHVGEGHLQPVGEHIGE